MSWAPPKLGEPYFTQRYQSMAGGPLPSLQVTLRAWNYIQDTTF